MPLSTIILLLIMGALLGGIIGWFGSLVSQSETNVAIYLCIVIGAIGGILGPLIIGLNAPPDSVLASTITAMLLVTVFALAKKSHHEEVHEVNVAQGGAVQSPGAILGSALATAIGEAARRVVSKDTKKSPGNASGTSATGAKAKTARKPKPHAKSGRPSGTPGSKSKSAKSSSGTARPSGSKMSGTGSRTTKTAAAGAGGKSRTSGKSSRVGFTAKKPSPENTKS